MPTFTYTDDHIAGIFQRVKTIAMVGASPKPHRASHRVMQFLQERGYRVIPVNTRKNDDIIHGEKVYSSLAEIPEDFQMVDIFRNIEGAIEITDEAIALSKNKSIETVWMQLKFKISPLLRGQKKRASRWSWIVVQPSKSDGSLVRVI
jgi:predicted CoA-binding protein